MKLVSGKKTLDLSAPKVIGVVNVTPDSFFAGSRAESDADVLRRAQEYVEGGAAIIEIGGESTGPNSKDVTVASELQRVIPAVSVVRKHFPSVWISVDTVKSEVAKAALKEGADLINDVSAGRADTSMFSVISDAGCPIVLMFAKDETPRTTIQNVEYDDVVMHVHAFLEKRIAAALEAGIARDRLIVDPGLGHFVSSNPEYSFDILRRLREFSDLGPVLVSPSRKSFLAGPKNLPPKDRLPATLDASELATKNGASLVRTHDVLETVRRLGV